MKSTLMSDFVDKMSGAQRMEFARLLMLKAESNQPKKPVSEEKKGLYLKTDYVNSSGGSHSIVVYGDTIWSADVNKILLGHGGRNNKHLKIGDSDVVGYVFHKNVPTFDCLVMALKGIDVKFKLIGEAVTDEDVEDVALPVKKQRGRPKKSKTTEDVDESLYVPPVVKKNKAMDARNPVTNKLNSHGTSLKQVRKRAPDEEDGGDEDIMPPMKKMRKRYIMDSDDDENVFEV